MFDQIAQQLASPPLTTQRRKSTSRSNAVPEDWNLRDRSEFHYLMGGVALRAALQSRSIGVKQLIVVQDLDSKRVAIFDSVAEALQYFRIPNSALCHRLCKGYCLTSRTLWTRYRGGELQFRRLPLQTDNSRPFLLIGHHLETGTRQLFSGLDAATSALRAEHGQVRACIENNHQPHVKGWVLRIATIDAILNYFPTWEPLDFRLNVAVTTDLETVLKNGNLGGFHKDVSRDPEESAATVWRRVVAQYHSSFH